MSMITGTPAMEDTWSWLSVC